MIEQKLTAREASRYDRRGAKYMSETGAAVLERSEESDEEKLYKKWEPFLAQATKPEERAHILDLITQRREPPSEDPSELTQARLREMSQDEVDKKFAAMIKKPEINRPEDLKGLDKILDKYQEQAKGADGLLGDESVAPGEVLRDKDSWAEYGWSDTEKIRVAGDLKTTLASLKLTDKQVDTMMEIFLSEGKLPEHLTKGKIEEISANIWDEWEKDPNIRHDYKNEFDIFVMQKLGITEKQIKHFILTDKFEQDNDMYVDYNSPRNIEALAWQIMHTPGKGYAGWGIKGERPLLEMRIVKNADGTVDTDKSRYRVNTANMVAWARYSMYTAYDLDRETPHNFFQEIALKKRYPLSLQEMLLNPDQYFVSEDGETKYKQMLLEWYKEAAVFTTVRGWDVAYRGVIGDSEELMKVFREMYNTQNLLTRGALGSNILNLMTTMPLDFQGTKDGQWNSDSKMGAGWIDIYRAYDSMTDFDNLQKILGKGSKFFTRAGFSEAIKEVEKGKITATGITKSRVFMGRKELEFFKNAFDDKGEISSEANKVNFIKLINIFGTKQPGAGVEFAVRFALRNAIAEKYGEEVYVKNAKGEIMKDENGKKIKTHAFVTTQGEKKGDEIENRIADNESLYIAEAIAWSLARPFGAAAKNDPDSIAHDYMAKIYNTQLLREKYPHRGDKLGNELTMNLIKRTGVDILNAVVTEAQTPELDSEGKVIYKTKDDRANNRPVMRDKTPMELFVELSEFRTIAASEIRLMRDKLMGMTRGTEEWKRQKDLVDAYEQQSEQKYQNIASQISIRQRVLSNYYEDHLRYASDIFKQVMNADEIGFDKFTDYNVFGGVRFKQAEFQKEVQDTWIHKIRYMLDTYSSLNFNQTVRVLDQKETSRRHWDDHRESEPAFHDVPLGEALFGHEMLNIPKFWKRDDKGRPINLRDNKGRKMKGLYEIDYLKVQENKQDVWKQWFMIKVAADLRSHKMLHGNDVRYNFTYYQNVIESLGRIPGNILQDEYKMKDTVVNERFFTKANIAWLREKAGVTNFNLYMGAILKDLILEEDKPEEGIGLLLALSLAMKAIVRDKV